MKKALSALILFLALSFAAQAQGFVNVLNPQVRASLEGDEVAAVIDDFSKWTCAEWGHQVPCTNHLTLTRTTAAYVWGVDGLLTLTPASTPAFSNKGLYFSGSSVNLTLHSRDLSVTGANNWVLVGATSALTATGADGIANSGSLITATGAANCATPCTILQTLTGVTNIARILTVYVQRVTGSGTLSLTLDGTTFTSLTSTNCIDQNGNASNLVTAQYLQCSITQTNANPIIGVQFGTSGDVFNIDFVELQTGSNPFLGLPTTTVTVTRNFDNYTLAGYLQTVMSGAPGFVVATTGTTGSVITGGPAIMGINGTTTNFFSAPLTNTSVKAKANNVQAGPTLGSGTVAVGPVKIGTSWAAATSLTIVANNGTKATTANTLAVNATMNIGGNNTSATSLNGFITRVVANSFQPADTYLNAMTIP